jgi:hypothetical protein
VEEDANLVDETNAMPMTLTCEPKDASLRAVSGNV